MREDFILKPVGDIMEFPLADVYFNGVLQPTNYGPSDQQHQLDTIIYQKGWLKSNPTLGFGILGYINAEFNQGIEKNLSIELAKDSYKTQNGVVYPVAGKNGFNIDLKYISSPK